ncbi:MAG: enoyl-CoA hydratase-related protein [Pseudomonadota bacterium]
MRILLLCDSFDSLSKQVLVALDERDYKVSVELDINDANTADAVLRFQPDLIVAPNLRRRLTMSVWSNVPCFVVRCGVVGDRGPSPLDWAILSGHSTWGVTIHQANDELDEGTVWASREFEMRAATKASIYRQEVAHHAIEALTEAIGRFQSGRGAPLVEPESVDVSWRDAARQKDRAIDWDRDDTGTVLSKIRSGDGSPGVLTELGGRRVRLYDAREAPGHQGDPGELLAVSGAAVLVGTRDNAVWIGHAVDRASTQRFKLPASIVLRHACTHLPSIPTDTADGYTEIRTRIVDDVAYLYFDFYNGALSSGQSARLMSAFISVREQKPKVIVLAGGPDHWCNGIHLNLIEASDQPAEASWANINALNDLSHEIITTTECLTVSALRGNAGAGGAFLARAADFVWAHADTVLTPHYKNIGNLYGSAYWTYLLPEHCGKQRAQRIVQLGGSIGAIDASSLGLIDEVIARSKHAFQPALAERAQRLARSDRFASLLHQKHAKRLADERARPLADYRRDELEKMRENLFGFDAAFHVARYNFVNKIPPSQTPQALARHRRALTPMHSKWAS